MQRDIFARGPMDTDDRIFETGELEIIGRLVDASNASLLCKLPNELKVIYKPIAGERPLWDFPDGNLASREVAAFYISEVGEFDVVPKTVLREGPFGIGAIQQWIETSEAADVIAMAQSDHPQIRNLALFDIVINNADRKFGHILITPDGQIFGCDHGVSLHEENKLRTVIWQFAEQKLTSEEIAKLKDLISKIDLNHLAKFLSAEEIAAFLQRVQGLIEDGRFSSPNPNWPAVPWPPY
jgi:uncharacterized repeat protein (TIGR03843 family)